MVVVVVVDQVRTDTVLDQITSFLLQHLNRANLLYIQTFQAQKWAHWWLWLPSTYVWQLSCSPCSSFSFCDSLATWLLPLKIPLLLKRIHLPQLSQRAILSHWQPTLRYKNLVLSAIKYTNHKSEYMFINILLNQKDASECTFYCQFFLEFSCITTRNLQTIMYLAYCLYRNVLGQNGD